MAFDPKVFRAKLTPPQQKIFDGLKRNIREDWAGLARNVRTGSAKPEWSDERAIMEVIKNNMSARPGQAGSDQPTGGASGGSPIAPSQKSNVTYASAANAPVIESVVKKMKEGLRVGLGQEQGRNLESPLAGQEKLY